MVVKTSPWIIWHSFHWEMGLCFCPLKSGLCECLSDRVKVMLSHSELGLEKWAVSVPVSLDTHFWNPATMFWGSPSSPGFNPWVGKIPWRRKKLPTPVFWPREFHGLYSPWGCKESDTTEQFSLSDHFSSCPWRGPAEEEPRLLTGSNWTPSWQLLSAF